MTEPLPKYDAPPGLKPNDRVKVQGRPDLGVGEVLRIAEFAGMYRADVVFDLPSGRKLETLPMDLLEPTGDMWDRLAAWNFDDPENYRLKQTAFELIHSNTGMSTPAWASSKAWRPFAPRRNPASATSSPAS